LILGQLTKDTVLATYNKKAPAVKDRSFFRKWAKKEDYFLSFLLVPANPIKPVLNNNLPLHTNFHFGFHKKNQLNIRSLFVVDDFHQRS
jgi:hypothetical protein